MAEIFRSFFLWPFMVAAGFVPGITPLEAVLWTPVAVSGLTVVQVAIAEGVYWWKSRATFR